MLVGCTADLEEGQVEFPTVDEPVETETTSEEPIEEEIVEEDLNEEQARSLEEDEEQDDSSTISLEELAQNNDASSCWVAYQGRVYDLTGWLRQHPGGAQAILPNCGTAQQFEDAYNQRHGERDDGLLRNEPIGVYVG